MIPEFILGLMLFLGGAFLVYLSYLRWHAFRPLPSGSILPGAFEFPEHPHFPKLKTKPNSKGRIPLPSEHVHPTMVIIFAILGGVFILIPLLILAGGIFGGNTEQTWLLILVAGLLAFIGIGLLGLAYVEMKRGEKYAGISVDIDHEPVAPGEEFSFFVRQPGKRMLTKLEVYLVGEEASLWNRSASSSGKTSNMTEKRYKFVYQKVAEMEDVPVSRNSLVLTGEAGIPEGAMHSLRLPNCRVDWFIQVRLLYGNGEDLRENFCFRVAPVSLVEPEVSDG
ncbi:MAG: hypothetical protein JJU11_03165 [Candidatus Sumerlaeia bacterium]|nr:hypothetical protein [Candidatus Sumerlaeia bacterium]